MPVFLIHQNKHPSIYIIFNLNDIVTHKGFVESDAEEKRYW